MRRLPYKAIFFYIIFVEVFLIKQDFLINEQIEFSKVQVVNSEGQKIGLMPTEKAIELAEEEGLDLVLVSPNPSNPVCKILDYSKYKGSKDKDVLDKVTKEIMDNIIELTK